jgi:phosphatidate cytidylyltransferase
MSTPAKTTKKSDLPARVLTAVVAVPILLWVLLAGSANDWFVVVLCAAAIGLYEFYDMTLDEGGRPVGAMGIALGTLMLPAIYYSPPGAEQSWLFALLTLVTVFLGVFLAVLMSYGRVERAMGYFGAGIAGVFYAGFMIMFLALLRRDAGDLGGEWILLVLGIVWGGDTGAYFAGRAFGKHKLAPVVSPKKTWEGGLGGLIASVGVAFAIVALTGISLPPAYVVGLAVPAAILGQLGDLAESLLKRSVGVKDSGVIIYGHGGLLDRIDALLFAAPYAYFYFRFFDAGLF